MMFQHLLMAITSISNDRFYYIINSKFSEYYFCFFLQKVTFNDNPYIQTFTLCDMAGNVETKKTLNTT